MEFLLVTSGLACMAWTATELLAAAHRPGARFGAVDLDDGTPLDVVLDRRTHQRGRRYQDRGVSLRG